MIKNDVFICDGCHIYPLLISLILSRQLLTIISYYIMTTKERLQEEIESSHQNKHHRTPKLRRRRRRRIRAGGTSRQSPSKPILPSLLSMTSSTCGDA